MSRNAVEKVDSEIALTALLTATVTGYEMPVNGLYPVFKVSAIGLLVLTLLRRMAIMQGADMESQILQITTQILDLTTFISILYCFQIPVRWLHSVADVPISLPLLFGILTPLVFFCVFLLWEIAYASALVEGERIFRSAAQEHQGTFLGGVLGSFADTLSEDRQSKLNDYREPVNLEDIPLEDLFRIGLDFLVTSAALIFVLLAYVATIWLSGHTFSVGWPTRLLIFITILVTSTIVRMWYSKYGIVKAEDRHGILVFFTEAGTFLLIGASLFSA